MTRILSYFVKLIKYERARRYVGGPLALDIYFAVLAMVHEWPSVDIGRKAF